MKKVILLVVCILGVIAMVAGAYALPTEEHSEQEKKIFYTIDTEVDGTASDILDSARIDN